MRSRRGRRYKRKVRVIVLVTIVILFCITTVYAAFSTNLTLSAKGNIREKPLTINQIKANVVTTGDGLYLDSVEQNRYIYRGSNPDNYICLTDNPNYCSDSNEYQIISIESDNSLKVVKKDRVAACSFDVGYITNLPGITSKNSILGTRYEGLSSNTEDYCTSYNNSEDGYYGCKIWGNSDSIYDRDYSSKVSAMPKRINENTTYDLPEYNSYVNVYLNGGVYPTESGTDTTITGWYDSQSSIIKDSVSQNHIFYIGIVAYASDQNLATDVFQEQAYTWKGNVGLINVTDYVRASNNPLCSSVYEYRHNADCYNDSNTHNWLYIPNYQRTMTPVSSSNAYMVWNAGSSGALNDYAARDGYQIRPVLFLKPSVRLYGSGTQNNPYYLFS